MIVLTAIRYGQHDNRYEQILAQQKQAALKLFHGNNTMSDFALAKWTILH